jgi:hypothetical protein
VENIYQKWFMKNLQRGGKISRNAKIFSLIEVEKKCLTFTMT